jgi:hypothetical protein
MDVRQDPRFVNVRKELQDTFQGLVANFHFDGLDEDAAIDQVSARFEELIQSATGPRFDDDGYIPPIETCTEAEVVRWFGFGPRREELLERIRNWIILGRAVKARRLLLDGSFVTAKKEPRDVDAVVLLPDDFGDQVRSGKAEALELSDILLTREPEELFAAEDEEDWWSWVEFFGRTREPNRRRKGLIEVTL